MQKKNRILKGFVATLLCLAIVSSCLVSGVFAKYVMTYSTSTDMTLKQMGVTLSMALDSGVTGTVTNNGGVSLTATVPNLKIGPGDAFYDALKVSITGTANVPVDIKMTCKVVYGDGVDYDEDGTVDYGSAYVYNSKCYMPIGFSCKAKDATSPAAVCYSWQSQNSSKISEIVMRNLAKQVLGTTYAENSSSNNNNGTWFYEKSYAKDTNFSNIINEFYIGMYWPYEYGKETDYIPVESAKKSPPTITTAVYDKMATQFASKNADISFVYTISITQA